LGVRVPVRPRPAFREQRGAGGRSDHQRLVVCRHGARPSGRYLAPANGPDCIEIAQGFGDCGVRTLEIVGPKVVFVDLSAIKRVQITGRVNAEFRAEFLNAFNHPTITGGTTGVVTPSSQRIIQLVSRVNW
jgi:hypothetical protein